MGRPASPWLQRCYEILADGRWHDREEVIREMVKVVPPGMARRRGYATSRNPDNVADVNLIRRGARQLCHSSINGAGYIENDKRDGHWLIRIGDEVQKPPRPLLFVPADQEKATHVILTIEDYQALGMELDCDFVKAD